MHERSLVKALIEQVLDEVRNRELGRVHQIQLQIGEFSGVESVLVQSAFQEMSSEYWPAGVTLLIEVVPLIATCADCQNEFPITDFHFVCSQCGHDDVTILRGEEMKLVSISAERVLKNRHQLWNRT